MDKVNGKKPKASIVKSSAAIPLGLQVTADENGLHQIADLAKQVAIQVFDDDKQAAEFFHGIAGYFETQHEIDQRERLEPTTWPKLRWVESSGCLNAIYQGLVFGKATPEKNNKWKLETLFDSGFNVFHNSMTAVEKEMQRLFEEFLKSTLKGGQA